MAPPPKRYWGVAKGATLILGIVIIALSLLGEGTWRLRMAPTIFESRHLFIAVAVFFVATCAHGISLSYVRGLWQHMVAWSVGAIAAIGMIIALAHIVDQRVPDELSVLVPRLGILAVGVIIVCIGLWRETDALHEHNDHRQNNWYVRTSRVLRAAHFWTPEEAGAQVRLARADLQHAQSHLTEPGEADDLDPWEYFGTPEEYAARLTSRPEVTSNPLRTARWYYLMTALVLDGWATYRTFAHPMNWLTVVLHLLALVAVFLFVWASITLHRSGR